MQIANSGPNVLPIGAKQSVGTTRLECRSRPQFCALGPPPPRTPGRADPQVPETPTARGFVHGRVAHLYFFLDDEGRDAGFGMTDIEIAVCEPIAGRCAVEVYCVGDGYQTGTGQSCGAPLVIEFRSADRLVASIAWQWPDVVGGRAEVMHLRTEAPMSPADYASLDRASIPAARAFTVVQASS